MEGESKITVLKVKDGKSYGAAMTPDELRGPVGDAVRAAIAADGGMKDSGEVEVEGRRFWWFKGPI